MYRLAMHMLNAVVLVVALLAACKKKEENAPAPVGSAAGSGSGSGSGSAAPDPGPAATCKDAGANYAKVMAADATTDLGKAEKGVQGLMKYSYEEACDTEWSEANKSCVAKATTSAEARACFDAKMVERLDLITKAEIEDMMKNKAANEAAKAGSGSATP